MGQLKMWLQHGCTLRCFCRQWFGVYTLPVIKTEQLQYSTSINIALPVNSSRCQETSNEVRSDNTTGECMAEMFVLLQDVTAMVWCISGEWSITGKGLCKCPTRPKSCHSRETHWYFCGRCFCGRLFGGRTLLAIETGQLQYSTSIKIALSLCIHYIVAMKPPMRSEVTTQLVNAWEKCLICFKMSQLWHGAYQGNDLFKASDSVNVKLGLNCDLLAKQESLPCNSC